MTWQIISYSKYPTAYFNAVENVIAVKNVQTRDILTDNLAPDDVDLNTTYTMRAITPLKDGDKYRIDFDPNKPLFLDIGIANVSKLSLNAPHEWLDIDENVGVGGKVMGGAISNGDGFVRGKYYAQTDSNPYIQETTPVADLPFTYFIIEKKDGEVYFTTPFGGDIDKYTIKMSDHALYFDAVALFFDSVNPLTKAGDNTRHLLQQSFKVTKIN